MSETQPSLENWEDFVGSWFKAEYVKSWPAVAVVVAVDSNFDDKGRAVLVLDLEYNGKKFFFQPNVGNTATLRNTCPTGPDELVGKKLVFSKTKARNPQTKMMVDSLQIDKVEA